jgi:carboxypeptidase C (cathepsin A)
MSTDTSPSKPEASDADKAMKARVEARLARPSARSTGTLKTASRTIAYRTEAAFMPVAGKHGEPEAAVLTTAYLEEGVEPSKRGVCFAFNGGPGSASVWLQFGALGPKRVVVPDDASVGRAPYTALDNPLSWLEHFDLVFIDPPHTGWSLTASEAAKKKALSTDGDIAMLAEVMRVWLVRHRRMASPLYLCGESYGTTRGAGLALAMLEQGLAFSGVILVSCAMDLQSIVFEHGNDLPYALFLPAFANAAQYHGTLQGEIGASSAAARAAAEAFVQEEYAAALLAAGRLTSQQRSRIAGRVAELTGLPKALVDEQNLRISDGCFFVEALRSRGLVCGRLDARAAGPAAAQRKSDMEFDPGIEALSGPYTMSALAHFAGALGLDIEDRYEVLNLDVNKTWDWRRGTLGEAPGLQGHTSTSSDLATALRRHPHLKVLAASGRYDLGTPYSASDWSLARLDAPASVLKRVTHRYYDAGHMMYTRQADLEQMHADLAAWLKTT